MDIMEGSGLPLSRLREQLDEAVKDLYFMRKHEGESPVYDRNIQHKQRQVAQLQWEISRREQEENASR